MFALFSTHNSRDEASSRCVIAGIRQDNLEIAKFVRQDLPVFDPTRPDPPAQLGVPASPQRTPPTPDGN